MRARFGWLLLSCLFSFASGVQAQNVNLTIAVGGLVNISGGFGSGTVTASPPDVVSNTTCSNLGVISFFCTFAYPVGAQVTLTGSGTSSPNWGGACAGTTGDSCTLTLNAATNVVANFGSFSVAPVTFGLITVTKAGTGSGTVTSSPSYVDCGTSCAFLPTNSGSITLTATPEAGSVFVGWSSSACPGTGTCSISPSSAPQTITATFDLIEGDVLNLSTRGLVQSGENVLIAGFVIANGSKTVVIRAVGPSLTSHGVVSALSNPTISLVRISGAAATLATNDNWGDAPNVGLIQSSGYAPAHPLESAIMITLPQGAYTAVVSGVGGATGVAVVEVYIPN